MKYITINSFDGNVKVSHEDRISIRKYEIFTSYKKKFEKLGSKIK